MKNIYYLTAVMFIALIFTFKIKQINNISKNFIAIGYFLIYPLITGLIPKFYFGPLLVEGERIFLIISLLLIIIIFFKTPSNFNFSKMVLYLFIYYIYLITVSIFKGMFVDSEIINYLLPIGLLLLMENVSYNKKDLDKFNKYLLVFSVIIFLGSLIQLTINPRFFSFIQDKELVSAFSNIYRNPSVFMNMGPNDGGIAIGFIAVIILFLNYHESRTKHKIIFILISFSVFLTMARYIWLMLIIALTYYYQYKYKKNRLVFYLLLFIGLFVLYNIFFQSLQQTDLYQKRIISESYKTRFVGPRLFYEHLLGKNVIFGFGHWSGRAELSSYGRHTLHNGILDIIFRGGLIGTILFSLFFYQIYKRSKEILNKTGNPIFIVFVVVWIAINLTAGFKDITYYGYFLMLFYLNIYYQLYVKKLQPQADV